jgi:hypothetical protein
MSADKCRPVVVDGQVIRVRGARAMNEQEVGHLTEIVRAVKHLSSIRPCPDCEQGKHANCTGEAWCNEHDVPARCPCSINQAGPHHLKATP